MKGGLGFRGGGFRVSNLGWDFWMLQEASDPAWAN
jgi:hypothetical protein